MNTLAIAGCGSRKTLAVIECGQRKKPAVAACVRQRKPAVETAPRRARKSTFVDYIILDGDINERGHSGVHAFDHVTRAGGFLRTSRRGFNRRLPTLFALDNRWILTTPAPDNRRLFVLAVLNKRRLLMASAPGDRPPLTAFVLPDDAYVRRAA